MLLQFSDPPRSLTSLIQIVKIWTKEIIKFKKHNLSIATFIRSQFHRQFRISFYTCRSQKRKKDWKVNQLFALWGSVLVKAACKYIDEIDPRSKNWLVAFDAKQRAKVRQQLVLFHKSYDLNYVLDFSPNIGSIEWCHSANACAFALGNILLVKLTPLRLFFR